MPLALALTATAFQSRNSDVLCKNSNDHPELFDKDSPPLVAEQSIYPLVSETAVEVYSKADAADTTETKITPALASILLNKQKVK